MRAGRVVHAFLCADGERHQIIFRNRILIKDRRLAVDALGGFRAVLGIGQAHTDFAHRDKQWRTPFGFEADVG